MRSIDYITYNDLYSGIYQSQVIDVISFLNQEFDVSINLIAFVPIKLWKEQSEIIKRHLPNAKVYPILGRVGRLSRTKILLKPKSSVAICRGPLAFGVAYSKYHQVVYDGRAAVKAEVEEYNVSGNAEVGKLMMQLEREGVMQSDACISVSHKLIEYWIRELKLEFDETKVFVIPCTLSGKMNAVEFPKRVDDKIRVVYSGGTGPWQSFDTVTRLLRRALVEQENLDVIFLTKDHDQINGLIREFPGRVERKWLKHSEVNEFLSSCDYGILIRDENWTNKVASPVKFAEYLNAGLRVLISESIGDFSEITKKNDLGCVIGESLPILSRPEEVDKLRSMDFCKQYLLKSSPSNYELYMQLLKKLESKGG